MVGDPIADFLIQVKNAGVVGKASVSIPYSKVKHAIADVLVKEGYLGSASKKGKKVKKTLEVDLVYVNGSHKISGLQRMSKPSRRLYTNSTSIPKVKNGLGAMILSTPEGIMTDADARKKRLGGEMLFKIW